MISFFAETRRASFYAAVVSSLFLSGCSGERIDRHRVSGKVQFRGRPVDYGTVIFEPEESVGQAAPTCFARIEVGKYETALEESPTTGTYRVRVLGFDKERMKVKPDGTTDTPALFPEYQIKVQIPPPDGQLDIEVPEKTQK